MSSPEPCKLSSSPAAQSLGELLRKDSSRSASRSTSPFSHRARQATHSAFPPPMPPANPTESFGSFTFMDKSTLELTKNSQSPEQINQRLTKFWEETILPELVGTTFGILAHEDTSENPFGPETSQAVLRYLLSPLPADAEDEKIASTFDWKTRCTVPREVVQNVSTITTQLLDTKSQLEKRNSSTYCTMLHKVVDLLAGTVFTAQEEGDEYSKAPAAVTNASNHLERLIEKKGWLKQSHVKRCSSLSQAIDTIQQFISRAMEESGSTADPSGESFIKTAEATQGIWNDALREMGVIPKE